MSGPTAPRLKLYHCPQARSFRVLWTLLEMGLPHELIVMPFPPRFEVPGYKTINPIGTVPTFFDGETRMTESVAICQYLATRYGPTSLAVEPEDSEYGPWLNWLYFGEATLTTPLAIVLRYSIWGPAEERLPKVVEDYTRWFLARLRLVDSVLSDGREALCANRFTLADISVGLALMTADNLGVGAHLPTSVRAYWERIKCRDGYQRAVAAGKTVRTEMRREER